MIVTKFGGTSLSSSKQLEKVGAIIEKNAERRVAVVSAPGKRFEGDSKITDLLYTLGGHLRYGVPDDKIFSSVRERFCEIETSLGLSIGIESELDALEARLGKNTDINYLVSRGEYFSARLMAAYLGYAFVDAADIMRFSFDGSLNLDESRKLCRAAYEKYGKMVVPGFYGAYPNGDINLFARGGSDITGAYIARFLEAEVYENWTDVSGIFCADPKIADAPRTIERITYDELRELSYMGAGVLHEESVLPVQEAGIDINIKNTNAPDDCGTLISCDAPGGTPITGVAGKKGFVSFSVHKKHMSGEIGFLRRVLSAFEKHEVNVEHTPSGMDMLSVIVAEEAVAHSAHAIISEIERELSATVTLERGIALVAVVGRNMAGKPGICASVFGILGRSGINVKVLAQAPDELTLIIGIRDNDYEKAIRALHEGLREEGLL